MKIKLIQLGKNKDSLEQAMVDFVKRLGKFCDLDIMTLKDLKPSKTFSPERCVKEEGEMILRAIPGDEFVVELDEKGKEMNSIAFAEFLSEKLDQGRAITFIIGGAFGLAEKVKERADLQLSFSKMTFTHQMIRIFLLEQLWRGFCIINGKEYHHD